jgi:hypothetical protein
MIPSPQTVEHIPLFRVYPLAQVVQLFKLLQEAHEAGQETHLCAFAS